jgi:hypothetical protein
MLKLFLLRKNKIFNKSRYSRNRQLARVIFYFALYINIIVIYGVFFVFYGLTFNTTFFWFIPYFETLIAFLFYLINY